jgi:hypothetical protein
MLATGNDRVTNLLGSQSTPLVKQTLGKFIDEFGYIINRSNKLFPLSIKLQD